MNLHVKAAFARARLRAAQALSNTLNLAQTVDALRQVMDPATRQGFTVRYINNQFEVTP